MILGIDPDATKEVEHSGARFTLGVVPRGAWVRLRQQNLVAVDQASRRAIASCAAEGLDPEGVFLDFESPKTGKRITITHLQHRTRWDPAYLEEQVRLQAEVVRWSLRGWQGVKDGAGAEVPLELEGTRYDGDEFQVVSRKSLRRIIHSEELLDFLYLEAVALNDLQVPEKKA